MKYKLLRTLSLLLSLLFLGSCSRPSELPVLGEEVIPIVLEATEDYGQDYLDSFIFLGESTTYHMKDRGVLRDGKNTKQIWAPDSGTVNLDMTTSSLLIRYPDTGELLTVGEAASRKRPQYMILTFGLNGAVQNVRLGADYYKSCYRAVLEVILSASPDTRIILQSAFPVSDCMDMSRYSVTAEELNRHIDRINQWTRELAEERSLRYLDTASVLKDPRGYLYGDYQVGDGYHLTGEAYQVILSYIRTHGYQ